MIWKRTITPFALSLVASIILVSGLSAGISTGCKDGVPCAPTLEAFVYYAEDTLLVRAEGVASTTAVLRIELASHSPGSSPIALDLPFVFDGAGEWELTLPLSGFQGAEAFDAIFYVVTNAGSAPPVASNPWGLRVYRVPEGAAGAPPSPAGGILYVPAPGTASPLFPLSWASILVPSLSGFGLDHLVFLCSVPGVEGVLPVN